MLGVRSSLRPRGLGPVHFLNKYAQSLSAKRDLPPLCVVVEGCMQTLDWPDDTGMTQDCAVKPERKFGRVC
jgi:hypothetical protein